jgi:hypothetical protein
MNVVCRAITEISLGNSIPDLAVNLVHPRPVSWNTIITTVQSAMGKVRRDVALDVIPMGEWVSLLEEKAKVAPENSLHDIVCDFSVHRVTS